MRTLTLIAFKCIFLLALNGQTNVRIEAKRQNENPKLTDLRLFFDSEHDRRYLIEVSNDLSLWEPHYLSPFSPTGDGYWVSQLDSSNTYTANAEFYRVSRLPWRFQTLDDSGDWIGDLVLTSNSTQSFIVYQNRDTNTLYYAESNQNGNFGMPSAIASTSSIDELNFWDNSGFSDISLIHYGTVLYLVCTDQISKKVIMLRKPDNCTTWIRHEISDAIETYFWAFPKFSISPNGILGVAYSSNDGTVFSYANHSSPQNWRTVLLTSNKPNSSLNFKSNFSTGNNAHVFIPYYGGFRVDTVDGSVAEEDYPEDPPSDLTPNELKKIQSTTRNEVLSNHIRLQDGRIVVALTNAQGVVIAVEDSKTE